MSEVSRLNLKSLEIFPQVGNVRYVSYNLFSKPDSAATCYAVAHDRPVPAFIDTMWKYKGTLSLLDDPTVSDITFNHDLQGHASDDLGKRYGHIILVE